MFVKAVSDIKILEFGNVKIAIDWFGINESTILRWLIGGLDVH